jgi:Leucine-rich repeat (LRR) protein
MIGSLRRAVNRARRYFYPSEMTDTLETFVNPGLDIEPEIERVCKESMPIESNANLEDEIQIAKDNGLMANNSGFPYDTEHDLFKQLLAVGLSDLGLSAELRSVYRKLKMSNKGLTDSDLQYLKDYPMLYTLDISGNKITDLHELGRLKYLVNVDASKNLLTEKIFFPGPENLEVLDLSENEIVDIIALKRHKYLQMLHLNSKCCS